eukprot:4335527-Alexandrium_andersonii.AAC.1
MHEKGNSPHHGLVRRRHECICQVVMSPKIRPATCFEPRSNDEVNQHRRLPRPSDLVAVVG